MNGKFYSPADQLCNEEARLSYAGVVFNHSDPSTPDTGNPPKRQRQFYEGEPDTTKWAVPPPPDIFPNDTTLHLPCPSNTDSNATEAKPPAAAPLDIPPADPGVSQTADAEPADASQTSSPRLSNEIMHQVRLLCSAQNDFERRLFEHRRGIQHEQEKIMRVIQARELVCPVPKKELEDTLRQHRADLDRADRRAIEKLDELRYQQQLKLESLGVPGFYPSSSIEVMQGQQRELRRLLGE